MENLTSVILKSLFLILLIAAGALARRLRMVSDEGQRDLGRLLVDLLWPALIVSSIAGQLTREDLLANATLPLFAILTFLTGLALGLIFTRLLGFKGDAQKIFLYQSGVNNYVYFPLIFVTALLPGKGAGLLFIHNLGYTIMIFTVGVAILKGGGDWKDTFKGLFSVFDTLGKATLPVAMVIAGVEIYKLGPGALRFDRWNLALGLLKVLIGPTVLFGMALFLRWQFQVSNTILYIFMLVNIMPVSVNSVSLALRYTRTPQLAAQSVVFTHLFCIASLVPYTWLLERYFKP